MPIYDYKARRINGDAVTGTLEANSTDAIAERLQSQGLIPVDISEQKGSSFDVGETLKELLRSKTVNNSDLVMFSRQMYSLTKAGVPLNRSITGLIETAQSIPLKEALKDILDGLTAGNDLATCFARHPKVFNSFYVSLIHVGENSGNLEEAFNRLSHYLELEEENRNRVKSAMRYPVIVITIVIVAFFGINWFVIPKLAALFRSMSTNELPIFTQILIGTSDFFVNYWYLIIGVSMLAVIAFYQWINTDSGRLKWDRKKLNFPIFGSIIYRALLARFARAFAMMSRAGVSVTHALGVVSFVVDNKYVGNHVIEMRSAVERGESITQAAAKSKMFSSLVMQMLQVGEDTGQVDEMLEEVAEFYEREVDYDIKKIGDYIEPIMIVIVGAMILVLALGVFLPVWDLAANAVR
ncbi:type II secretion system F family protein [Pleionea sediminis]|uniref:type II secretion system F family protein n=1 Tax=Pleionea sediminis TaxID=2569479 RepID=UPI00118690ED|nr:type II secretion system F family protein [Pleionea sediminis]